MNIKNKTVMAVNGVLIAAILVLNYFYQINGFDFTLKCICSGGFALLGLINLGYAAARKAPDQPYYLAMACGLALAFLGDVLIKYSFVVGAAVFALGHLFFVAAYCLTEKMKKTDLLIGGALFLGCLAFLLLCPLLRFEIPAYRGVCVVYALIISAMLGKAAGNFSRKPTVTNGMIAVASVLFFFSDLMLVFDWFIGLWNWTDHACMSSYYPALCLLALSMFARINETEKDETYEDKNYC